jgi:hypothetical protein
MAYDSQAISSVLDDKNKEFFTDQFPVFYCWEESGQENGVRRKISTIDEALARNQLRSIDRIIDYITKYQNKWVYASLFHNNLVTLLEKGIKLEGLFRSSVLVCAIKSPEWPSVQADTRIIKAPYSESIFDLRTKESYEKIFG